MSDAISCIATVLLLAPFIIVCLLGGAGSESKSKTARQSIAADWENAHHAPPIQH